MFPNYSTTLWYNFSMKNELQKQITEEWLSEFIDKKDLLAKAERNIAYWLDTEDHDEQTHRFKATELVLKLAEIEAKRVPTWKY